MPSAYRIFILVALLVAGLFIQPAVAAEPTAAAPEVSVATRVVEPFVFEENGKLTGFSVELWNVIAERIGVKSSFKVYDNIKDVFEGVKSGHDQAAIAAISITADRMKTFDFSIPMFDDGMGILVPDEGSNGGVGAILAGVLASNEMRMVLIALAGLVLIPAHLIWFTERNLSDDDRFVRRSYLGGVGDGAFWVATALVGASDGMPRVALSRIIGVICCYCGLIFATFFTAIATSTLTTQQIKHAINGPDDLKGKVVATVSGSSEAAFLKSIGAKALEFPSFKEAVQALESGKAVALCYDAPVLSYYAGHAGVGKVSMVGDAFNRDYDGIVLQLNSDLRLKIDAALLGIREDGTYKALYDKWFGH